MLNQGDMAPDFEIDTFEGSQTALGKMLDDGNNLLLVFLRHLG